MTNKFIVYAVKVDQVFNSFAQLCSWLNESDLYRVSSIEHLPKLANVQPGDIITTKKGNKLYVVNTYKDFDDPMLTDFCYHHEVKESKILNVVNVKSRSSWDKSYVAEEKASPVSTVSMADKVKSMFMPTKVDNIAISVNGDICVATKDGYVAINSDNELVSYPSELVLADMPAYVISKPVDQVVAGDIVQVKNSYVKVVRRSGVKLTTISYTGSGKTVHTIKDILLNQNLVRVVMTLTGSVNNQINPMMFMMLAKDGGSDNLLPLMMMNQQNGSLATNPMLMALAMGDGGFDSKTLLMTSMMGGSTPFGNLFNAAPAKKEAKVDVVEPVEEVDDPYVVEPVKDVEDTDVVEQD